MTPEQQARYNAAQHKIQTCAAYEYGQKEVRLDRRSAKGRI
jgi:hypothetical protein